MNRFEGSTLEDLDESFRLLLGEGVLVGSEAPRDCLGGLFPVERAIVLASVPKRREEFATGRLIARRLLERMRSPSRPLLPRPDRSPDRPRGIAGSISHTDDLCIVTVGATARVASIGLDVEQQLPLQRQLWRTVCTRFELDWLARCGDDVRGPLTRLVFSIKECVYKCQYPVTGRVLGWQDVEVRFDLGRGRFEGRLAGVRPAKGFFLFFRNWIVCGSLQLSA